eukprot:2418233-Pleurochrysis_carterae.AAC.1
MMSETMNKNDVREDELESASTCMHACNSAARARARCMHSARDGRVGGVLGRALGLDALGDEPPVLALDLLLRLVGAVVGAVGGALLGGGGGGHLVGRVRVAARHGHLDRDGPSRTHVRRRAAEGQPRRLEAKRDELASANLAALVLFVRPDANG